MVIVGLYDTCSANDYYDSIVLQELLHGGDLVEWFKHSARNTKIVSLILDTALMLDAACKHRLAW